MGLAACAGRAVGRIGVRPGAAPARAADDPRRTPAVEIYQRWKDSVVYLTGPIATGPGPSIDEFFRIPQTRQTISIGSGFVIHHSGYIVTNAHGTERVITEHATLSDGRTLEAELVGLARDHDLALLKITSGMPLRAVQLAQCRRFPHRRAGDRHRKPRRVDAHLHARHRQRGRPINAVGGLARRRAARADPERRGDQSGQLRRPVVQCPGPGYRRYGGDQGRHAEHRLRRARCGGSPNGARDARTSSGAAAWRRAWSCSPLRPAWYWP